MPRSKIQKRSLKRNQNKNQNKQQKISNKKRQQNRRRRQQRLNGGGGNAIDQMLQKELLSGGAVMRGGAGELKPKTVTFVGFVEEGPKAVQTTFDRWMKGEGAADQGEAPGANIEAIYGLHNGAQERVYNMLVFQKAGEKDKVSQTIKPGTNCTGFKLSKSGAEQESGVTLTITAVKKEGVNEVDKAEATFGEWSECMIQTTDVKGE